jgi:hypothetical protein
MPADTEKDGIAEFCRLPLNMLSRNGPKPKPLRKRNK